MEILLQHDTFSELKRRNLQLHPLNCLVEVQFSLDKCLIGINFQKLLKCRELNKLVLKKEHKRKFFLLKGILSFRLLEYFNYKKNVLHYCLKCHAKTDSNIDRKRSRRCRISFIVEERHLIISSKRNRTSPELTAEFPASYFYKLLERMPRICTAVLNVHGRFLD